jgi:hypothetical protein
MWLGYKDRAFYWLEQGIEHRHLGNADSVRQVVKVDPSLAPLHSDARFKVRAPPHGTARVEMPRKRMGAKVGIQDGKRIIRVRLDHNQARPPHYDTTA